MRNKSKQRRKYPKVKGGRSLSQTPPRNQSSLPTVDEQTRGPKTEEHSTFQTSKVRKALWAVVCSSLILGFLESISRLMGFTLAEFAMEVWKKISSA